jgi:hypothetical protein
MLNRNRHSFSSSRLWTAILTVLISAPVWVGAQASSSDLDAIRAAMAAGEFQPAQKQIDKQLFPTPQDPARRYELLMLKGECRLQLKDRTGSSTAFKSAAKVAGSAAELAAARANALIVERSTSGRYAPRAGSGGEPIDIMAMESRKRAMNELRGEMWSQYKPKVEAAARAEQLPPIEAVFTPLAEMYCLELFAAGQASETGAVIQEIGGRAYRLMQAEVSKCGSRVDYLNQLANSAGSDARGWNTGRMGLTSPQRDEVKSIFTYLNKIGQRAIEYRGIAARLGGNEGKWEALVADVVGLTAEADSLYNDR